MKVIYDEEKACVQMTPTKSEDEQLLVALVRTFIEGGEILVRPATGKRIIYRIPAHKQDVPKCMKDFANSFEIVE